MKNYVYLLLMAGFVFLFLTNPSEARFDVWDSENGEIVRQGHHVFWTGNSMVSDENGNWAIAWTDAHLGTMDVFMQLYDENGNEVWTPGGITIASNPYPEEMPLIAYSGNGEWIIIWNDYSYDVNRRGEVVLYAQKLNSAGEKQWGENGVFVGPEGGNQVDAKYQLPSALISTSDGGVICVYENGSDDYRSELYMQRLDTAGNYLWGDQGILIADQANSYEIVSDGNDGFYIIYSHQITGQGAVIAINRIDADGNLCFNEAITGLGLSDPQVNCFYPQLTQANNGVYACWTSSEINGTHSLRGQQVSYDGEILWGEYGTVLFSEMSDFFAYEMVSCQDNLGFEVVAKCFRSSLFAQKVTSGEENQPVLHWGTPGEENQRIIIEGSDEDCYLGSFNTDNNDGFVCSYVNYIDNGEATSQREFSLVRYNNEGSPVWDEPQTFRVSPYGCHSQEIAVVNNRVIYTWRETAIPISGIFYQTYDINNGQRQFEEKGRPIVSGIGRNTSDPKIVRSGEYAYVSWNDERYSRFGSMPYVQKLDLETGEALWANNGINICPDMFNENDSTFYRIYGSVTILPDNENGAYAFWGTDRYYGQRILPDGTLAWGEGGIKFIEVEDYFFTGNCHREAYVLENGEVLVIIDGYLENNQGKQIRMQKLNSQGELLFGSQGILLHENTLRQRFSIQKTKLLSDGSILIVYLHDDVLKADRVSPDGGYLWDEPEVLRTSESRSPVIKIGEVSDFVVVASTEWDNGYAYTSTVLSYIYPDGQVVNYQNHMDILDSEKHFILSDICDFNDQVWICMDDDESLYIAELNDAQCQINENDVQLVDDSGGRIRNPRIISDDLGGVYVFWENGGDIYYKHFDTNMQVTNEAYLNSAISLVDIAFSQSQLDIVPDQEYGVLTVWNDWRATTGFQEGDDVYAMRIFDGYDIDAVDGNINVDLPSKWALNQAYPNPFNPSTTISFSTPHNTSVKLLIFDIMGREVARLVDGNINAGDHSIIWNAKNSNGIPIASGTYIYRMEGEGFTQSKTMILLK